MLIHSLHLRQDVQLSSLVNAILSDSVVDTCMQVKWHENNINPMQWRAAREILDAWTIGNN